MKITTYYDRITDIDSTSSNTYSLFPITIMITKIHNFIDNHYSIHLYGYGKYYGDTVMDIIVIYP